jgi:hypothetical protein
MNQRIAIRSCINILQGMQLGWKMSTTERAQLAVVIEELQKLEREARKHKISASDILAAISWIAKLCVEIFAGRK